MNTDIRISVSFKNHHKRRRLRAILGPDSTDYLIDLWISVAMSRPSGVLSGLDNIDVAIMANWPGDPDHFVAALVKSGWIDQGPDGVLSVHEWPEHNGWASAAVKRSEKAKNAAIKRWERRFNKPDSDAQALSEHMLEHDSGNAPTPSPKPSPSPSPSHKNTAASKISFDVRSGIFSGIGQEEMALWGKAYPAVDLAAEINRAASWLVANPTRLKSNYKRFLDSWFSRKQDGASNGGGNGTRGFARGARSAAVAPGVCKIGKTRADFAGDFPERADAY